MRYAESHREETHKRLLKVDAAALREKDTERPGITEGRKEARTRTGNRA
jgi:hypothetical protein